MPAVRITSAASKRVLLAAWTCALLLAVLPALLGTGCGSRPESREASAAPPDTLPNGLPRALLPGLADWLACWRQAGTSIAPESLTFSERGPLHFYTSSVEGDLRWVEGARARAGIIVLAPDSAHAVDFDRYVDIDPESGSLERDVDSSPMLFDFVGDTLWTVSFCGTSCSYDGAAWIDAERFALTGVTQTAENLEGPTRVFLDVVDLRKRTDTRWLGPVVVDESLRAFAIAREAQLRARLAAGRPARAALAK